MPEVSIVVPVYNTEKYLERCIESIKKQTLSDIEIIIIDDGSAEGCASLCDKIADEDERIRVIHKENAGLGFARNSGIEAAKGKYIGFVDSDDYIEADMYKSLYDAAVKYDADLVLSGICFVGGNMFDERGECIKKSYFDTETVFEGQAGTKKLMLGIAGALPHEADDSRYGASVCKNLFKKATLEEKNLRFLSERKVLSEDTLFMVEVSQNIDRAVGLPGAYYCYCRNGESLSKAYKSDRFERSMDFLKELEERLKAYASADEYRIYLDRLTQGFGRVSCSQEIIHARDKKIPYSALRSRLKEICTREEIKDVLKKYPWYKLPVKQAVFAATMKYRLYLLQKLIVTLRG